MRNTTYLFTLLLLLLGSSLTAQVFVDSGAGAGGDGSSWANAYNDLEAALSTAVAGDEVWVATGTYVPNSVFLVATDLTIIGGFSGNETAADQADPAANPTTLSGDVNGDDSPTDSLAGRTDNIPIMEIVGSLTEVNITGFEFIGGQRDTTPEGAFIDDYSGGAIRTYSTTNVANCNFSYCYADYGAAITAFIGADNCTFTNLTFSNNVTRTNGTLYANGANIVTVTNATFTENETENGSLYLFESFGLSLTGSSFVENNALGRGAGVTILRGEPVMIDDCDFVGNSANRGGAAYFFQDSDANRPQDPDDYVISNCNFDQNSSRERGGAIYELWTNVTHRNNTFSNNISATGNGGAYYAANTGQIHVIENCLFDRNMAPASRGGGHYSTGAVDLEMTGTTFLNNSSSNRGGGMYALGSFDTLDNDILIEMDNVTFQGNTSNSVGGAYYVQSPVNTTRLNIANSNFFANKSTGSLGGAIGGINGFIATIENCQFFGNASSASAGGAIFFNNRLMDEFLDDEAFSYTFTGNTFSTNAASSQGGAIDLRGGSNATFVNNVFSGNIITTTDGGAGGAIIVNGDSAQASVTTLVNNTFFDNLGRTLGSDVAVYVDPVDQMDDPATTMTLVLQNNAFTSNTGLLNVEVEDGDVIFESNGGNLYITEVADVVSGDMDIVDDALDAEDLFVNTDFSSEEGDFNPTDDLDNPLVNNGTIGDLVPGFDIEGAQRDDNPDIGAYEAFSVVSSTEELTTSGLAISFFPNPVQERLQLRIDEPGIQQFKLSLIDLNGRRLGHWNVQRSTDQLDFSGVASGTYFLEVLTPAGKTYSQKVIKQ